jgi:hypothetical protein
LRNLAGRIDGRPFIKSLGIPRALLREPGALAVATDSSFKTGLLILFRKAVGAFCPPAGPSASGFGLPVRHHPVYGWCADSHTLRGIISMILVLVLRACMR